MNSSFYQITGVKISSKNDSTQMELPAWKRAIDITCCLVALPFLCVITVFMAIVLKIASPGPVFFRQERVGYKGSRFMCFKFRTMFVGADTKSHQSYCTDLLGSNAPMVKLDAKGDSRVIPGGWLLRATGIDELPQIINVLQREMSIVGPRPCLPYEYDHYQPWQKERFKTAPGLTGLWQVSGKNRTTFDEMVKLDIRYAQTSSFALDITIILKTVPALLIQLADIRKARVSKAKPLRAPAPTLSSDAGVKRGPQAVTS